MRKNKSTFDLKLVSFVLVLWIYMTTFSSCFEAEKACLDISATNFEPSADESCCCTYPLLKTIIIHRVNDTLPLVLSKYYSNGTGDSVSIIDFAYYLSDFTLYKQNDAFYVTDTVVLGFLNGTDTISIPMRDDIVTVQRNDAPIHIIDTFPYQGIFSDISFRIGLKDSLDDVLFNKTPSGHVLGSSNKGLYDEDLDSYHGMWMTLERTLGTMEKDTLHLMFDSKELPSDIHRLTGTQLEQTIGFDMEVILKFDYSIWMDGVDIQGDINTIKAKILQNMEAGISVYQE